MLNQCLLSKCCQWLDLIIQMEEKCPDWVSIYFVKVSDNEQRCNICEINLKAADKSHDLLQHIKQNHKEVYDLHKQNPDATVGFRIEFLHVDTEGDPKTQPEMILEEVCEATTEEVVAQEAEKGDVVPLEQQQIVLVPKAVRKPKRISDKNDSRKRSWVWKYFNRISNIIFRCNLCEAVLSIKGCNTNNMNRHIKSRHPSIYKNELLHKKNMEITEMETPVAIKTEAIDANEKDANDTFVYTCPDTQVLESTQRSRRSWIWLYFNQTSLTTAKCKLCNRNICHGGNATGNMNRHLKMIHHKTGDDTTWVWKVFESNDDNFYGCKICSFQCTKADDLEKSVSTILHHLRTEHGVISGDQIITGSEYIEDEIFT